MDWIDAAQDAAIALGRLLSQDARLIELDCALPGVFVPERFEGREGVCEGFRFEIDCLSPTAFAPLAGVLGQPATLRLRRAAGSLRAWNGLITHTSALGSDGGLARYRLTLEPWTALLRLRTNALIFQDLDVLGVVTRVFADYPHASWRADVTQAMPRRPITTQYRESDWDFVTRLLADQGLAWRIDHTQDSHTLVIHDAQASAPLAQPANVRYHRIDATESMDAISRFAETHGLAPDAVAVASWDASIAESTSATTETADPAGAVASREVFRAGHVGRFANRAEAAQAGRLLLDALRLPRTLQTGSGSERGMAPGHAFTLSQHPELSGQTFVPLVVEHTASNNLGNGIVALLDAPDLERGSYRNRFLTVIEGVPVVPTPCHKPLAPGAQTAIVVGLPDAAITSSRDHQVRIQFAWQRGATPNRGGLTEAASSAFPEGHAPGDHTSGTWVRVAEWLAGPNWGSHALPRIGSEVLVEFLHADIDQPIVTGQLYNGDVASPFAAGHDAAANHIGTLSGLHTQSLDGSGTQQWVMDDAPGQLRQRLHSTLADARLELGFLVEHGNQHRGGLRGQGFDLATLGWGNLRAGQGMLLSTTLRSNAASTQMDDAEAISQLRGAEQTTQALDDALGHHDVPGLKANDPLRAFTTTVEGTAEESPPDDVNADAAPKPFGAPAVLAEGPDRIAIATPKSALAYAGGHLHLTSQDDAHLAAGQTLAGVSGGHVAFFAQQGPLRAIAANGQVSLQAHTGTLELLADQSVTITATDERVEVLAKEKIVLQAGQSAITLEGGNVTFACPGNFTVKASKNPFLGGARNHELLNALPAFLARGSVRISATLVEIISNAAVQTAQTRSVPTLDTIGTTSTASASAIPSTRQGDGRQFVNFATAEQRWIDGTTLKSLERQTQKPKIQVRFSPAGAYAFTISSKPDAGNAVYSTDEQSRNTNYTSDNQELSYTTNGDGTLVVEDIQISAAGANKYAFEVKDSRNVVVATDRLETTRRIYLQEIVMKGHAAGCAAENLNTVINEFRKFGIEFIRLPRQEMEAMPNIDLLDEGSGDQAKFETLARQAYAKSEGPRYEPYTLAVVYTDHLAFKDPAPVPFTLPGEAGPRPSKVRVQTAKQNEAQPRQLWNGLRPGEDWFISAHFVPDGTTTRVAIDRSRCTAIPTASGHADESSLIEVDLTGLLPVATRGTIHILAKTVMGWAGGAAIGGTSTNAITICTRAEWKARSDRDQNRTLIHEIGHKIGMTPGGPSAPTAYNNSKLDQGSKFYYDKGHYGNHCHAGLPNLPSYRNIKGSQCVMYGSSEVTHFCKGCGEGVRKTDISLGWSAF